MSRALAAVLALALACPAAAGEPIEILSCDSSYRLFLHWRTPVVAARSGELVPLLEKKQRGMTEADRKPVPSARSPLPPDGWHEPGFDDRSWARDILPVEFPQDHRATAREAGNPAAWALIAARGMFYVEDPGQARGLRLSLVYAGGVVVRVNGQELVRAHLPKGALRPEAVAEPYPPEAYLRPDGKKLPMASRTEAYPERFARRVRRLADIEVPAAVLRQGTNVLAIECRRAPLSEVWLEAPYGKLTYRGPHGPFGHVGLLDLRLTAQAGVSPNVARPEGLQVWTCRAFENLLQWHHGDPCETPALRLVGCRNGAFSGRIVISSAEPIRGVCVEVSDLEGEGASLPAAAIEVRYADRATPPTSWVPSRASSGHYRFDRLLAEPPAEVAAVDVSVPKRSWGLQWSHPRAKPGPAAVLPAWLTVHVPADAKPGLYRATATVEAQGAEPTRVPLAIRVHDWALPSPRDFASHNNLYQSHESTALYYDVPLWSDRHFALMGRALELSTLAADKFCVVHLVAPAYHMGNSQSMARWVRRGDGGYDHDFSLVDRYFDLYEAACGKPGLVLLVVFVPRADHVDKTGEPARWLKVSRLDPATGRVEPMDQPPYGTPRSVAFWRPVLEGVLERLRRRGWLDVAALGTGADVHPQPATVAAFHEIWPEGPWMSSSHTRPRWYKAGEDRRVPVFYRESVWGVGRLYDPEADRQDHYPRPWASDSPYREWAFPRVGQAMIKALYDSSRLVLFRAAPEASLQGGLTGIGRVGADFLPLPHETKPGRFRSLCGPIGAHLGPAASTRAFVGPGSDGPVATERLEMFRQGVQVREALLFLQRALEAEAVDEELARRCTALLDERARTYLRTRRDTVAGYLYFESGLLEREGRLFALCAEVAEATGR
ncbi:MAG: glycoside hydrolase domain-containing protein [Candidatus Brocadiia bacterium]